MAVVTGLEFCTDIFVNDRVTFKQGFRWNPLPDVQGYRVQWSFPNILGPTWNDILIDPSAQASNGRIPDTVHIGLVASGMSLPLGRSCIARIAPVYLSEGEGEGHASSPMNIKLGPWTRPTPQFNTLTAAQIAAASEATVPSSIPSSQVCGRWDGMQGEFCDFLSPTVTCPGI